MYKLNNKKVSVIIPVFNAEQYLGQCLDTVLRQSLSDIEIILINDASTDASQHIIDEYQSLDNRIHSIKMENNGGVSAARNAGIDKATGEFVIFLDADDYWEGDEMLDSLYRQAVSEKADFVSFGFCRVDDKGEKSAFNVDSPAVIDITQQGQWPIKYTACAKLISRSFLNEHTIRFETTWGEDALFSITLYCHAKRFVITDDIYYCYRINPQGACLTPWDSTKLFGTVNWFAQAIPLIRNSDLYKHHPEALQSIFVERLNMLLNKLGTMALDIFTKQERIDYYNTWAKCLEHLDQANFNDQIKTYPDAELYRKLVTLIKTKDTAKLEQFFQSEAFKQRSDESPQSVVLTRQQAIQLGRDILQINKAHIRCDLGNGTIVTLPKHEAHQLAQQLVSNQKPRITLKFK